VGYVPPEELRRGSTTLESKLLNADYLHHPTECGRIHVVGVRLIDNGANRWEEQF
jgi:hypothetical protein